MTTGMVHVTAGTVSATSRYGPCNQSDTRECGRECSPTQRRHLIGHVDAAQRVVIVREEDAVVHPKRRRRRRRCGGGGGSVGIYISRRVKWGRVAVGLNHEAVVPPQHPEHPLRGFPLLQRAASPFASTVIIAATVATTVVAGTVATIPPTSSSSSAAPPPQRAVRPPIWRTQHVLPRAAARDAQRRGGVEAQRGGAAARVHAVVGAPLARVSTLHVIVVCQNTVQFMTVRMVHVSNLTPGSANPTSQRTPPRDGIRSARAPPRARSLYTSCTSAARVTPSSRVGTHSQVSDRFTWTVLGRCTLNQVDP
jgi:hypothetical protein